MNNWSDDSCGKPTHKITAGLLDGVQVVTFSVALYNSYRLPYDAFGLLIPAERYQDWQLITYRIERE